MTESQVHEHPLDLVDPIPANLATNQSEQHQGIIVVKVNGLHEAWPLRSNFFVAERISRRVRGEMGWFENIVSHAPSVGSFYEAVLRSALKEVLPERLALSSGFVYSRRQERHSKQLDLIVHTREDEALLYKQDDFAIVQDNLVHQVGECKKTLTKEDLTNIVDSTLFSDLGARFGTADPFPRVNVFAFASKAKTSSVVRWLDDCIRKHLSTLSKEEGWWVG